MVKRVVVGAHYGLRDWLVQRVTGAVIGAYALVLGIVLLLWPTPDFLAWKELFAYTYMRIPTFLVLVCLFVHAWVGMRDILMDYIGHTALRLALQIAVILALVMYTIWSVQILWGV